MKSASEIRDYISNQSKSLGIDPALSLGLAELTGFSPKWTDGKRVGIMSLPKDSVTDIDAYQANPKAQIDAGLLMLSKSLEDSGNEFAALSKYTDSPKAAFKAYVRTARNRGQAVTEDELAQSMQSLGLDLNPADEARKAGLSLAKPRQQAVEQRPPMPQQEQAMQPTMQDQAVEPDEEAMLITSTNKQRKERLARVFGSTNQDGDIPQDFLAHIKGLM